MRGFENISSTSTPSDGPRDSQQQTQLYEQLTWNSDEQLLNQWPKTLFWFKNDPFLPKKGPKQVKNLMSEFQIHLLINKQ